MGDVKVAPTSWLKQVRNLTNELFSLVFPPVCVNCRKVGELLCADCQAEIPWVRAPICPACGRILLTQTPICDVCRGHPLPLKQIRAATVFSGIMPHVIHRMKYNGAFALAGPLAEMMVQAWPDWEMDVDLVIPIPLHPQRQKKRGYNQSELLVRAFCDHLSLPHDAHSLRRVRSTPPQVGLNAVERQANMHNAFVVNGLGATAVQRTIIGKNILLVDDVCTTGATLAAAADVLLAAGANSVSAYCVARAI